MNINISNLAMIYALFGREGLARMLTLPGGPLVKKAAQNKDEPEELIAKRDAMVTAMLDFIEEWANFDND